MNRLLRLTLFVGVGSGAGLFGLLAGLSFFLFGAGPIIWTISSVTLRQHVTPAGLLDWCGADGVAQPERQAEAVQRLDAINQTLQDYLEFLVIHIKESVKIYNNILLKDFIGTIEIN